jgi:hypothetical protein
VGLVERVRARFEYPEEPVVNAKRADAAPYFTEIAPCGDAV